MGTRGSVRTGGLLAAMLLVAALTSADGGPGGQGGIRVTGLVRHNSHVYSALIRRTGYGIPHILAADLPDVAFGQGWAYAQDRICDLDNQVVKVRSQLSRWLGPGPNSIYLGSDLAYLDLGVMVRARARLATLTPTVRDVLEGYAAGFNGYLAKTGPDGIRGWCSGQPWITPINVVDLLAYERDIAIKNSGTGFLRAMVTAQPPTAGRPAPAVAKMPPVPALPAQGMASNGWAIGGRRSAAGRGMLVANPHYPWQGPLKLWECHLTVPGALNVYGASLGGLPGVQIGFNDHVAWTHTVSSSAQFTLYRVDLVPGRPTSYFFDGHPEAMTSVQATVTVRGAAQPFRYTLWSTRYGPVLNLSGMSGKLQWTRAHAITYRDAAIGNGNLVEQWLGMDRAATLGQFQRVFERVQGIPWLNTVAADDKGTAWYIDGSAVPNLSRAAANAWARNRFHVLDGGSPRFSWVNAPGARGQGLVPYRDQPQLTRRDYVFNANNSYWLANPAQPLTGFSPLYGPVGSAQSPRTRANARALSGRSRFTLPGLAQAVLSERSLTADLLAGGVLAACRARSDRPVTVSGHTVDIAPACRVLAAWDLRFDVAARGAVIWEELINSVVTASPGALTDAGPLFRRGFDPARPVNTPEGSARDSMPVLRALAQAVLNLRAARVPLDAPLGSVRHTDKDGRRMAVPGAGDEVGILNVVDYVFPAQSLEPPIPGGSPIPGSDLTSDGYVVNNGTSYLLTMEFTASGPVANALLTFSESDDPSSPHYADQTALFAEGRLRRVLFTERDIRSDPDLRQELVTAKR